MVKIVEEAAVNVLAVGVAALSSFMLGGLWYSPAMFLKIWEREEGMDCRKDEKGKHPAFVFGFAFLLALLAATALARLLGPAPELGHAVETSLTVGVIWVGGSFGINYLFGGKSFKLWLVNAGYHVLQFLLYGVIFGLWH
jgi:hypothetical protein